MRNITNSTGLFLILCLLVSVKTYGQRQDSVTSNANYRADSTRIAQGLKINGIVKDAATGKPLGGITVSVSRYSSVITDDDGRFSASIPDGGAVLVVKGPGFHQKNVSIKDRSDLPDILLYEETFNSVYNDATLPLGIVATNSQPNSILGFNTLGSWQPTSLETPDSYLQGRVAGLNVIRRSGTPNIGANLFLRGFSSISATNAPLIVVDGMIFDTNHYGSSIIPGHISNPFGLLDLRDVKSYTVIKDASANIYGTKSANGIINITTNTYPDVATRIDLGMYASYNYMPSGSRLPVMQTGQFRTYLTDLLRTSPYTDEQVAAAPFMNDNVNNGEYYDYHNDTDWQKQVYKNGYNKNLALRVSGGDDVARYVLSLGYGGNAGITKETDLSKYSTRFNGNLNISPKMKVNTNLSFNYATQNLKSQGLSPKTNPIYLSLIKAPFLRAREVDASGAESPNLSDADIFDVGNPASLFKDSREQNQSYRFFGNVDFKYQLSPSFSAYTLFGITTDKVRENWFIPRNGISNDTLGIGGVVVDSRLANQVQRLFSLYSDTRVSYARAFSEKSDLAVSLGVRFQSSRTAYNTNRGINSSVDELISVTNSQAGFRMTGGDIGSSRWLNNYLTATYTLNNKYFFGATVAADASSRFGTKINDAPSFGGVEFAILPSVSAGWLVSSEKFMAGVNSVEHLKLRASYGLTGNDDIGNYTARQYYVSQNLLGLQGLVRGSYGNNQLQWEVNRKLNLGADASFLSERLNVTLDWYRNATDNMITQSPAPGISQLAFYTSNDGGMRTTGWEASVSARIINKQDLKWDLGFNISQYNNTVTKLPGGRMTTEYAGATILTEVGAPAGRFFGYKTNGVYTSNAEAASAGVSIRQPDGSLLAQQGGDVRFADINNDKVIDASDRQVIGDPNPDHTGGIFTNLNFKAVTLNALFTFANGNSLYNYTRRSIESQNNFNNQSVAILNRWRGDGHVTNIPRASFADPSGNSSFSDRWIEDGSYMRLRTLSLTYNVPVKIKAFRSMAVYLTGNNLLTFTKYLGYDPEFAAGESVLLQGIDNTVEPQFKTVQLGLRLGI